MPTVSKWLITFMNMGVFSIVFRHMAAIGNGSDATWLRNFHLTLLNVDFKTTFSSSMAIRLVSRLVRFS